MKTRDIFALSVRLLGLFFLYLGLKSACGIWNVHAVSLLGTILAVICFLAVAWWLIGGAPLIMQRAYPDKPE